MADTPATLKDAGYIAAIGTIVLGIVKVVIPRVFRERREQRAAQSRLIDTLIDRVDALQLRIDQMQVEHTKQIDELQEHHQREIDELRDLYNERVARLEEDISAWKDRYATLEQRYRTLQSEHEEMKQRLADLMHQRAVSGR